jgi:hypothetical protein
VAGKQMGGRVGEQLRGEGSEASRGVGRPVGRQAVAPRTVRCEG